MQTLKVLQLCNKPPQPKIDGGCIAINNISEGLLRENIDLKIITVETEKHPFNAQNFESEFLEKTKIESVFIDTKINLIDAFSALVTSDTYNVSRFFSADFDKKLSRFLQRNKFDIVHLESLFMTPYISTIRRNSKAKIVLRSHNLEHIIWQRLSDTTTQPAKKLYLKHLASRLKKYEQKTINEVDGIATISFEDTQKFQELKCKVPICTIPFGIDLDKYPIQTVHNNLPLNLFHIGALNWQPNLEAVNWFLKNVWPKISNQEVLLHLAGRDIPDSIISNKDPKIKIHGEVNDAKKFMTENQIMIVPLLSGSGMRVKIIEGMALGKLVITTQIGAEGIACEHNKNILIANSPDEFCHLINRIIQAPNLITEIGNHARNLVESQYDNKKIIQDLIVFYHQLIDQSNN